MPKATVTVYLKRLEAAGFVRREIDPSDLRRHRLLLTATGRKSRHGRHVGGVRGVQQASRGVSLAAQQNELKKPARKKSSDCRFHGADRHPARVTFRARFW